ncbi:DUF4375 domain-containing protein [Allocoprobacillus halotolerans]|uniref:DUF4375 domain-containing protein n=1 Tax=Allocoprobacillus halotolerans TaxID=2944914 RepID=A0ABY5I054_9FIRM|nr:DUF4375 domain-containing protein [Allocoprobacillus halotolerans]UTY38691.1 DUF4375 domain-containing protein [Allocoprobacillus halotolerans]
MANYIVWGLFIAALLFLGFFFMKRINEGKAQRQKAMLEYEEKKERYSYLRPGVLDVCPREDVTAAALFHCMRKENDDFDHYFENMNESEKTVYGIYMLTTSLEGRNPSLHSFFLSPATQPYVPIVVDIFERVGSHELADLMKAAKRFAEIIENDEDDDEDDPEMGDYARYNFSDFTNEFITLVSTTNLNEKLTQYVLEHKEDFYDNDIPEQESIEGDEDNEERVSDEI